MRAFIGIDFDTELKNRIFEIQKELKKYAIKGRWKYIDNFHLTLKFLDEINIDQKAQIDNIMGKICADSEPFSLQICNLGTFNSRNSIRVLWLGLAGDINYLQSLYENINQALIPLGFAGEKRKFSPHITIGQNIIFKDSFDKVLNEIGTVKIGTINVKDVYLFKSEQIDHKRIYSKISNYSFNY